MTPATAQLHDYAAAFERIGKRLPGLAAERRAALARFRALGFPTASHPDWKGADVSPIARAGYEPAENDAPAAPLDVRDLTYPDEAAVRFTFVDGRFEPALSTLKAPAGVTVRSFAADPSAAPARFAKLADAERAAFVALNTAYFRDAALVEVAPGAVVEPPIHVVHLQTAAERASYPRTFLAVGERAEAKVVESYAGPAGLRYLTDAVTEVDVGAGAHLTHVRLQRESEAALHVATTQVAQATKSTYRSVSIVLGGAFARHELDSRFEGEGGESALDGLFAPTGKQFVDNHTWLDHAQPHCSSREVYKGVLAGAARGVFYGRIVVRPGAQKTDAKQTNKNLLLSRQALVDSTPQLEIYADDVKCTHGSTTGQLEEEQLFYLRTRGIGRDDAVALLTHAFARDIVDRIPIAPLAKRVDELLHARLAADSKAWDE